MAISSIRHVRSDFSVLIVDDEQFLRQILTRIVKREGYKVEEALNGQDALDKMAKEKFDLVITDIKMPEMDGMELLEKIRTQFPETLVVIITSYAGEVNASQAIAAGASQFITKPFKNVEISRTLDGLIARRVKAKQPG